MIALQERHAAIDAIVIERGIVEEAATGRGGLKLGQIAGEAHGLDERMWVPSSLAANQRRR